MRVELITYTQDPEQTVARAGKTCYSQDIPEYVTQKNIENGYLQRIHAGCYEHAVFTFAVEGVSRALSHQLVRHRLASFDQQSQRYCKVDVDKDDWYVMPKSIESSANVSLPSLYRAFMDNNAKFYKYLCENGVPNEDARFILPNACKTNIVVTMNARELMHFFNLRCCNRAQWEIKELADKMLAECKSVAPKLFVKAGPSCVQFGRCPEEKSCGRINEMRGDNGVFVAGSVSNSQISIGNRGSVQFRM